jgi:hypothetical protein
MFGVDKHSSLLQVDAVEQCRKYDSKSTLFRYTQVPVLQNFLRL